MSCAINFHDNTVQPVFFPMKNIIQNYAWGSTTSISHLFGIANENGDPQAEIWMGAHPGGCSSVMVNETEIKLSELIAQNKLAVLGERTYHHFGELPYLFKVLAAGNALSIQVHPNKKQAEVGFARENDLGIPMSAYNRNYKDPNHKPELVYALTEYQAMNGFRPITAIIEHFCRLAIPEISELVNDLIRHPDSDGLASFFSGILSLEGEEKEMALVVLLAQIKLSNDPVFELISELATHYPGDIGLFAPLILNVITLKPGEAMYLDAETPHAYLKGTGLEIMANSDNVLRAGLTPKYIDVAELASCTVFEEKPYESLLLAPESENGIAEYSIPVDDFKFAILEDSSQREMSVSSAEILLPLDTTMLLTHANGDSCVINKGESVFIPAYAQRYRVQCKGRVARAYC